MNEFEVSLQKDLPGREVESSEVCVLSLKRTKDSGTRVYVKSKVFEEFFKGLSATAGSRKPISCSRWKGISLYPLPDEIIMEHLDLEMGTLALPEERLLVKARNAETGEFYEKANITFLRHIGLSEGVSFLVGTTPCRTSYLKKYLALANEAIRELYSDYISPFQSEVVVTSERRRVEKVG